MPLLGLPSGCNAQAYNCCGFSCCRAWALDVQASVVAAPSSTTLQYPQLYNRMGRTRDLKKIRDTKGTFHAKMGTIKDRNGMGRMEAEDIKKR